MAHDDHGQEHEKATALHQLEVARGMGLWRDPEAMFRVATQEVCLAVERCRRAGVGLDVIKAILGSGVEVRW